MIVNACFIGALELRQQDSVRHTLVFVRQIIVGSQSVLCLCDVVQERRNITVTHE
jgi:hypothetical protein